MSDYKITPMTGDWAEFTRKGEPGPGNIVTPGYCSICAHERNKASDDGAAMCHHKAALKRYNAEHDHNLDAFDAEDERQTYRDLAPIL